MLGWSDGTLLKKSRKSVSFQRISPLVAALLLGSPILAQSAVLEDYIPPEVTAEDIEAADDELFRASLEGFEGSLTDFGRALIRGDGFEQDVNAGVKWLEIAGSQGSVPALMTLGELFSRGELVDRNQARAFDAYERASALNEGSAYLRIARLFESGRGGTPDPDRALAAYDEAILLEVGGAEVALARGHIDGRFGELSDPDFALEIFEQAVESTKTDLRPYIGDAFLRGKGLPQDVDRGLALLNEAADGGSVRAQFFLGAAYSDGQALEADAAKALAAYEAAVALGDNSAYLRMARLYEVGRVIPDQPERAIELYQTAAAEGLVDDADLAMARGHLRGSFGDASRPAEGFAIYNRFLDAGSRNAEPLHRDVGELLLTGADGIPQDVVSGLEKIELACDLGQAWACSRVGRIAATGEHLEQDGNRALSFYQKALDAGLPNAHLSIGRLFEGGSGLPVDPEKAMASYRAAFDAGLTDDAEFALARGHIRNLFGDLSDPQQALAIYQRYVSEDHPRVAQALGRDIGEALFRGEVLEQDTDAGLAAIRSAAEAGSGWAWIAYGRKFTEGEFIEVDQDRALEAYENAVALGLGAAHFNIGRMFEDYGIEGLTPDPERALAAYQAGAEAGQPERAQMSMARGHLSGRFGDLSDPAQGRTLFEGLAEAGNVDAMVELGRELVRGERLDAEPEVGLGLLEAAAVAGNERAKREILSAFIRDTTPRTRAAYRATLDANEVETPLPIDDFTRVISTGEPIDYAAAWDEYLQLDSTMREAAARVSSTNNRRLFVGLMQGALNARGIDAGPVDGLFGRRTAGGYREFCTENFDAGFCGLGPLHRDAREPLTEYIASTEVIAETDPES